MNEEKHHVSYNGDGILKVGHERIDIHEVIRSLRSDLLKELRQTLNDFWLLDVGEWGVMKEELEQDIKDHDKRIQQYRATRPKTDHLTIAEDEALHSHHEDIQLRDFLIVLREKVDFIMMHGLYKKHKTP
jgi:hypothetical protein